MTASVDTGPELAESAALDCELTADVECECMLCDLPAGEDHGPVEWRVTLHFPGPYPLPGTSQMLLCDHCKCDWTAGQWGEPYNNFSVTRCVRV